MGDRGGTETVTLNLNQIPSHSHSAACSSQSGTSSMPAGNFWAANANAATPQYASSANASMNAGQISQTGGNQPHDNLMPYLAVNFIIALEGIYPSPN
jgi:microcystin-dependent protein